MAFFLFTRESNFTSHCVSNKIAPLNSFEKLISHSMFYIHTKVSILFFHLYKYYLSLEFIDVIFYYSIAKGMICANYDGLDFRKHICKYITTLLPLRYITPTPIQYKPLGEAEVCDIRNMPSPTSPNSAYKLYVR